MNHKTAVLLKRYARESGRTYDKVRKQWLQASWRERTRLRREMEATLREGES